MTRASERLGVTQPAVSSQIRKLEGVLGTQLIYCKGNTMALTKSGEALLPYAETLYKSALGAEHILKNQLTTSLRLGIWEGLTLYLAPLIELFNDLYPTIRLKVREGHCKRLVNELLHLEHDLCVVASRDTFNNNFSVIRLSHTERMVLVAAPKHPLAEKLRLRWEDLAQYPLILQREGSVAREMLLKGLMLRNISPPIAAEIDGIEIMKQFVSKGKGLALMLLPSVQNELDLKKLTLLPFPQFKERFAIDIVHRQGERQPPPCENFLSLAKTYFAS